MKFLVVGLGSMGKRRIRCLKSLNISNEDIIGYDIRKDRREAVKNLYNIKTVDHFNADILSEVDAVIISTPPDRHLEYITHAIDNNKPAFVEASVILKGLEEVNRYAREKKVLIAPSCTLIFHPAIKEISKIINEKKYGKITNFSYHSGQYLPDWHPWESIHNFYVSKRETGGAREIVPFELTWMTKTFGYPKDIKGYFKKTYNFGCDIDDTYAIIIEFENFLGTLIVDVVSRKAIRKLNLNFENAYLFWDWESSKIEIYDANEKKINIIEHQGGTSIEGYNKNIIEEMYIEEMNSFINAIQNNIIFPNSLDEDISVLKLLQTVEGGILP